MPNKRRMDMHLADSLRNAAEGSVVVHPPVAVLSQWVEQLCVRIRMLRGESVGVNADGIATQLLWQEVMPETTGLAPESEKRVAARLGQLADKWIRQWYVTHEPAWLDHRFFTARQKIAERNQRNQWLDAESWTHLLTALLQSGRQIPVALPESIQLEGFHELTALEQVLLCELGKRGVKVWQQPPENTCAGCLQLLSFADLQSEVAAAAHWARQQLREGKQKIAVVVNDLDNQVGLVRRSFENVFYPQQSIGFSTAAENAGEGAFYLPAGQPLAEYPVVESALALLQMSIDGPRRPVPFSRISSWLLSPFWAGAGHERQARAQLEVHLRNEGVYQLIPATLHDWAARAKLTDQLSVAIECSRVALRFDGGAEDAFYQCLVAWGWPGPVINQPGSQQVVSRFVGLLERLRKVTHATPRQTLMVLRQLCTATRIKGQGGPLSPVQILSPDDAAGRSFDAAWVLNLHEGNWPGSPLSNPFLPRDAGEHIPRASFEGELDWTLKVTRKLQQLAPEIIFSWGKQAGDVEWGPSALLSELPVAEQNQAPSAELHHLLYPGQPGQPLSWAHYGEHPWLVAREDGFGVPLRKASHEVPAESIAGGAGAINDQSALPLLSYLKHRLRAEFAPVPDAFANLALRGSLLHAALQRLYQPHVGTSTLPAAAAIPAAVEAALLERNAFQRLAPMQYQAEQQRLIRVLEEWLEKDRLRTGFHVYALEHPLQAELAGHPIRIRADRIDQFTDGGLLVIDYKSSKRPINGWARERLGEAQLPLYARLLDGAVDAAVTGIALATVRYGECQLDGIVQDGQYGFEKMRALEGKSRQVDKRFADWSVAMDAWRAGIDALATEYISGACSNTLYDRNLPGLAEFQLLLRHDEGEAWLQQS